MLISQYASAHAVCILLSWARAPGPGQDDLLPLRNTLQTISEAHRIQAPHSCTTEQLHVAAGSHTQQCAEDMGPAISQISSRASISHVCTPRELYP